jgi:serine/threonine protein kinase
MMRYEVSDSTFSPLLQGIQKHFNQSNDTIWEKRNSLKVVAYQGEPLVVKSFKVPHLINKIAYTFFRGSKAKRSYYNSLKIAKFVPQPIGYSEYFRYGILYKSYFISREYRYDFTIREPLTQADFPNKKSILKAFAHFTHTLHLHGVEHLDYSPGNILIKEISPQLYEFKIIDVNRMRFKKFVPKECLENFAKLWSSDEDLETIITEYASLIHMHPKRALDIVKEASHRHKERKRRKKHLLAPFKRKKAIKVTPQKEKNSLEQISVVMIAKNASQTIKESLDSLGDFKEVILYLNDSTDTTKTISQSYSNVKIIEGEFIGFGPTKKKAQSYSSNDWILSLDSDEVLTPQLLQEMCQLDLTATHHLYALKRINYFLGHTTQHNNIIVRLYHRQFTSFDESLVHEKIIIPKEAKIVQLKASFKHLYISHINQTLYKMIHYTDLGSKGEKNCYFITVITKALYAFFKSYILQGNITKGWIGYALAVNAANKRHYKYLKQYINCLQERQKREDA